MDIGIIGAGQIDSILARRLAPLGHEVRIANSRGPESLAGLAAEPGTPASCMDLDRAALQAVLSKPDAAGIASRRKAADDQARPFFEAGQTRPH